MSRGDSLPTTKVTSKHVTNLCVICITPSCKISRHPHPRKHAGKHVRLRLQSVRSVVLLTTVPHRRWCLCASAATVAPPPLSPTNVDAYVLALCTLPPPPPWLECVGRLLQAAAACKDKNIKHAFCEYPKQSTQQPGGEGNTAGPAVLPSPCRRIVLQAVT